MKLQKSKTSAWKPLLMLALFLPFCGGAYLLLRPGPAGNRLQGDELPDFSQDSIPQLELVIDADDLEKLHQLKEKAYETGILVVEDDDWVKAKLRYEGHEAKAKARLKGDWIDHLKGKKWSFRIQVKAPDAWKRMVTFSVQSPETRGFLNEWVFHKILDQEGVLTTRYDFMQLHLNGENLGLYVYEEHFDKQLVESRNRREGPILKFREDALWNLRRMEARRGVKFMDGAEVVPAADIAPFKSGRTLKDPGLRRQFLIAQDLMFQYKYRIGDASDIFDPDQMGKFLALIDFTRTYHGLIWHNQRYYYNPITGKLEPIGFDGDSGDFRAWFSEKLLGEGNGIDGTYMINSLMADPKIREAYWRHLERFCSPEYLDGILIGWKSEIEFRERLVAREFENQAYDWDALRDNAQLIQEKIDLYREKGEL